ncbi:class I SAM-dependent methyltransferase [Marinicauda sp. Alg238-R41]|uniref:class I SAM-dependent methyltransferase n=1 Tax=Marinicauda sp. Alg238-R41 TaxID=2993447 RepID=UPI0022E055B1|nr:class I SAM-dependent methyltransferase [Marinicauda sp. Alg238-R41]
MKTDAGFWNRSARKYAASPVADEESYEKKLAITRDYLTPDSRVLELGCGTGTTALKHAPFVQHILATDISEQMIEIARQRAAVTEIENVDFEVADIDSFQAPMESFDVVMAHSLLHLLKDRRVALSTIHRLLKPGGHLVMSTACLAERMGWFRFVAPFGRLLGLLPRVAVFSEADHLEELEEAGFRVEQCWRKDGAIAVFVVARKEDRA